MNIIAIDFGHCEDAGTTISEITFSDGRRKSFKVDVLKIQDKDQIILSQIFLTNEQMQKLSGKLRPTFSELKGKSILAIKFLLTLQQANGFVISKFLRLDLIHCAEILRLRNLVK